MTEDDDFPTQDPVAQWRREGERLERQRRFAKRALRGQEQQATAQATAAGLEDRVNAQLVAQKDFLIEVCGQALGQHAEQLREELLNKIDALEKHYKALQDLYTRELAVANSHIQLLQKQLNNLAVKRYGGDARLAAGSELSKFDA